MIIFLKKSSSFYLVLLFKQKIPIKNINARYKAKQ